MTNDAEKLPTEAWDNYELGWRDCDAAHVASGHLSIPFGQSARPTDEEMVERLCDFHKRLSLCFEGATGEHPPARPMPFEPKWDDLETLLDAASSISGKG